RVRFPGSTGFTRLREVHSVAAAISTATAERKIILHTGCGFVSRDFSPIQLRSVLFVALRFFFTIRDPSSERSSCQSSSPAPPLPLEWPYEHSADPTVTGDDTGGRTW